MKNMTRIAALALTLSMTAGLAAQAATVVYQDTNGNWAQTDIDTVTRLNIMRGYSDNNFQPNAWLTRSEFVNMSLAALGLGPDRIEIVPSFSDVSRNNWNYKNIEQANDVDLMQGYPENVFRPENPVRRSEALVALANASKKPMVSEAEAEQILSQYSDASQVPSWARRGVATSIKYNLFANEQANMIEPNAPATRADVAAMLGNLVDMNGGVIANYETGMPVGASSTTTVGSSTVRTTDSTTISDNSSYTDADRMTTTTTTTTRTTTAAPLTTVNLPPNMTFTGTVAKAVYSEFNKPGDKVMLILDRALIGADGRVVAPAGSKVLGEVTAVERYNETNDPAEMTLRFNEIQTLTGERLAINGAVANDEGMLRGDALNGVVIRANRSTEALKSEMRTAMGGEVGTYVGKIHFLEEPLVSVNSTKPLTEAPFRPDIVIGVGDRLQVKLDSAVTQ